MSDSKYPNSLNISTILSENSLLNTNNNTTNNSKQHFLSINSICVSSSQSTNKEPNSTLNELSSIKQIDSAKVDLQLVNILNQEFIEAGFLPILSKTNEIKYNQLVKNSADLLQKFKRNTSQIEKIQDQYYKLDQENELFLKRQQSLKENCDVSNRDLNIAKEKCRQVQIKLDESNKVIKNLNDQIKKTQTQKEQRDKQFKMDRNKVEKEIEKLKARIQSLTVAKVKDFQTIDLSEHLHKGNKAGLHQDNSNKQLESYIELIKDYDRKTKSLMAEMSDFKSFICNSYLNLEATINELNSVSHQNYEENHTNTNDSGSENGDLDIEELVKLPYDSMHKRLSERFGKKLKLILKLAGSNIKALNTTTTISPIASSRSNTTNDNNNATLSTIHLCESKMSALSPDSLLVSHYKKADHLDLSAIKEATKKISVSSSSLSSVASYESGQGREDEELWAIISEKTRLAQEKRLFYEEKVRLEQESMVFRKEASALEKTKKDFQKDVENFYKSN